MKLLLTSGGLENQSIINALSDLVKKPFSDLNIAVITTASNLESGDKWWLIDDLRQFQDLKFSCVDIVDISALPKKVWLERLNSADVLIFEGGNTYHLMYWINKSGLGKILPKLLKTKVYMGISAGSLVVTPKIHKKISSKGLFLVDFMIEPHINNKYFPELSFENLEKRSKNYDYPIYGLDDNSAIKVIDKKIEVVSEGEWKKFN